MAHTIITFLAITCLPHMSSAIKLIPRRGEQVVGSFDRIHFLFYQAMTTDADPPGLAEPLPLLVFLHGRGESGFDEARKIELQGPPKFVSREFGQRFMFHVLSPQCPWGEQFSSDPDLYLRLIREISQHPDLARVVDRSRIYLTGVSMGGEGVWSLAARQPSMFAAIAPICGYSSRPRTIANIIMTGRSHKSSATAGDHTIAVDRFAPTASAGTPSVSLPTWVVHGSNDDIVEASASDAIVEHLQGISRINPWAKPEALDALPPYGNVLANASLFQSPPPDYVPSSRMVYSRTIAPDRDDNWPPGMRLRGHAAWVHPYEGRGGHFWLWLARWQRVSPS